MTGAWPGRGRGWGGGGGGRWAGGGPVSLEDMPALEPPPPGVTRVVASCEDCNGLDSIISYRFGRAPYLVVVDVKDEKVVNVQCVENKLAMGMRGVGIAVGQWVLAIGAKVVLAPRLGPNAAMVLSQAGVSVIDVEPGLRLRDALARAGLIR